MGRPQASLLGPRAHWANRSPDSPYSHRAGSRGTRGSVVNIRHGGRNNHYFSEARPSPGFRLSCPNLPGGGPRFSRLQPGWLTPRGCSLTVALTPGLSCP